MKGIQFRIDKITSQIQSILIKPSIKLTTDIFDINFSKFCIEGLQIAQQIIKQCCDQQNLLALYEKLSKKIKDARRFRPNIEDENQDSISSNDEISDFLNSRRPLKETKNLGELNYFLDKMEKKEKDTQMFLQNLGHIKRNCEVGRLTQFQDNQAQTEVIWVGNIKNFQGLLDQIKQTFEQTDQAMKSANNSNIQIKNEHAKELQQRQSQKEEKPKVEVGQQENMGKSSKKIEGDKIIGKIGKKSKQSIVITKKGNDKQLKQRRSKVEKPTSKVKISIQKNNNDISNFAGTEKDQESRYSGEFKQIQARAQKQKQSRQILGKGVENVVPELGDKKNMHNRLPSLCQDLNESRSTSKNHTERPNQVRVLCQDHQQSEKKQKTEQIDLAKRVETKMLRNSEEEGKKIMRDKKGKKQNQRSFSINESENIQQRQKERSTYKNNIKNQPFTHRVEPKIPFLKLNTFNSQNNQDEGVQVLQPIQSRVSKNQPKFHKSSHFSNQQSASKTITKELSSLEQKKTQLISLHQESLRPSFMNQQGKGLQKSKGIGGKTSQESLPSIHKNKKTVGSQQQTNQQIVGNESFHHLQLGLSQNNGTREPIKMKRMNNCEDHTQQICINSLSDEDILNNLHLKGSSESLTKKDAMILNKISDLQKNSRPNQDQIKFYMQALQKLHKSICGKQCRHLERYYKQLKIGQIWHNRIAINLPTRKIGFFS